MHSISLASDVNFGENIRFVLGSYDHFSLSVSPSFFSQLSDYVVTKTDWCSQSEQMDTEILLSALKTITMKLWRSPGTTSTLCLMRRKCNQKNSQRRPKNAGIDPSTMRVSKWYQESTGEGDDPRSSPSGRVSDVFTGTNRMSHQVREPIENDEERLAMKRGDMPPPVPKRVANPRIQEIKLYRNFIRTRTRCTVLLLKTNSHKHRLTMGRFVFPQSVRKTGTHVELYNLPTYQCSILFNNMGSFNGKSEFRKPQNLNKPVAKGEKFNVADLSLLREFF